MNNKKETITGLSIKGEAILVYLIPLLGFIFSFLKDKVNKEARWIYNQAGAVWLSSMIISVAGLIVAIVPIVGIVFSVMLKILSVVLFVFLIIALVKAYEELIRLNKNGFVTDEECPAIKQEIERLLA